MVFNILFSLVCTNTLNHISMFLTEFSESFQIFRSKRVVLPEGVVSACVITRHGKIVAVKYNDKDLKEQNDLSIFDE